MNKTNFYYFEQTPLEITKYLFSFIEYKEGDTFFEPFSGEGAFYDLMPQPKDWCEIQEGKDFFSYNKKCDHIITNPPFKRGVYGKNLVIPSLEYSFKIANKSVSFLISHNIFNSITVRRLRKWREQGWRVSRIILVEVKKWYGRYYFITFKKDNGESLIIFEKDKKNKKLDEFILRSE